jgi:hypothetical protein
MPFFRKYSMLLLSLLIFSGTAFADVDKDKDKKRKNTDMEALMAKSAGRVGDCNLGSASNTLDVNNVEAGLYNNGGLFWQGSPSGEYEVPKGSGQVAIFASGIWIGGLADGELRVAAATYSDWEFWPGPLDAAGQPPADCSVYDRIFRVSREDIKNYAETGVATPDMTDWPAELGAPVEDGDGNPDNYNLDGGDLPGILGDQSLWWIMNDAGNLHLTTETPPIGLEVQVLAFAFNQAGALGNSTFYKYKFTYKGSDPLTDVYLGLWSDPDLGDAGDDYVGSDSLLGIGYVMNGDNLDEGSTGYGARPPALGYDFFQGPLVDDDGVDNNNDGQIDEEGERVAMAKFVYYNNNTSVQGNPNTAQEYYQYLAGQWRDGTPITEGGSGLGFSTKHANYMFYANPGEFWSEDNIDGAGTRNPPDDRRFLQSAGPFTMLPGDEQEIVFGIVWSQAGDRFSSVGLMKADDAKAQAAFDVDFDVPPAPDAPRVTTTEIDGGVILSWSYNPSDNNYLNSYEDISINLVVPEPEDDTYTFEGYVVYQYASAADQEGEIIAVYDRAGNNVKLVTEVVVDPATGGLNTVLLVPGTDGGLGSSHFVQNLVNYRPYFFGVQAYAYNAESNPQWFPSPVSRVEVIPSQIAARDGGTVLNSTPGTALTSDRTAGGGGGSAFDAAGIQGVRAEITDPSKVTGDTYAIDIVEVGEAEEGGEHKSAALLKAYNLRNATTGAVLFDAAAEYANSGKVAPFSAATFAADGVSFTVTGPEPAELVVDGSIMFVEVAGPDDSYACGPNAVSTFGCAEVGGNFLYPSYNGSGQYILYHEGAGTEDVIDGFAPQDYEIRFTEQGSYADNYFTTGVVIKVPFEIWDIGATYTGTNVNPNDPSDDIQMIPVLFNGGRSSECFWGYDTAVPGAFGVFDGSTPRVYGYYATTTYADWEAAVKPFVDADPNACPNVYDLDGGAAEGFIDTGRGRPIQRMIWNGDAVDVHPAFGVVNRFYTTKPLLVGDTYEISTSGLNAESGNTVTREESLDKMTIVPNPYLGASDYEVSRVVDVARLTNLPERATIRIFTLSGTLIRLLEKNSQARHLDWDLNTEEGLPIASGMYLIHIDAKDSAGASYGERVLKFAAVKKRVQLNEL